MAALLFFVFALCFLVTPYWNLPKEEWQKVCCAVLTAAAGLAWVWSAAGPLEFRPRRCDRWLLPAAILMVAVLNSTALVSDLAWRGDEDHHFKATQTLVKILGQNGYLLLIPLAPAIVLGIRRLVRRAQPAAAGTGVSPALMAALAVLALATVAAGVASRPPFRTDLVARYPPLATWLAAFPVAGASMVTSWVPEIVYRLVPALSTALVAWAVARQANLPSWGRLACVAGVATVPSVLYYSSVLYLEMPAVALMVIAGLGAGELLARPPKEVLAHPAWYALVLLGFVKENTVSFLGAFLLCRLIVGLREAWRTGRRWHGVAQEIRLAFAIVLPFVVYYYYRTRWYPESRPYIPRFEGLWETEAYPTLLRAFWDQYGLGGVLFVAGGGLLALRKQWRHLGFLALALAGYLLMHLVDNGAVDVPGNDTLGYSRYMLMFCPVLLAGAGLALRWTRAPGAALAAVAALLSLNLLMCPMNLDGSRKPSWGQYRYDYSEYTYPYRRALGYILERYPGDRTILTGLYYQYWFQYYTGNRADIEMLAVAKNADPSNVAEQMFALARRNGVRHVLYHVLADRVPRPERTYGFAIDREFRNSACMVVLYSVP